MPKSSKKKKDSKKANFVAEYTKIPKEFYPENWDIFKGHLIAQSGTHPTLNSNVQD